MPFPSPAANETNGTPTAGYISLLANYAAGMRSNFNIIDGPVTATYNMCLYAGGVATPLFVTSSRQRDAWATQRRRGDFGKVNGLPF